MRSSEWVAAAYFGYLCVVALLLPPWPRRIPAAIAAFVATCALFVPSLWRESAVTTAARDWLPVLYLVAGYWLSGWYFVAPMERVEALFLALDKRVLGEDAGSSLVASLPSVLLEFLEGAYVMCFLFVPGGLILLVALGHQTAANRFWTLVLMSELGSFAVLPWIQTRPPRLLEGPTAIDRRGLFMREMNRLQVSSVSIGVNTFPSGHVAGALATAIAVAEVMPGWAPWLFVVAAAIAFAAVLGRYHFFIDAVAGAGLALAAWALVRLLL